MKWRKRGLIYKESGRYSWCRQRTYLPTVDVLDDRLRVYFASLDDRMVGQVGWVEVEKDNPSKIIRIAHNPVLVCGDAGLFDENGVTPSWVGDVRGVKVMLYYGWMKTIRSPQILFTGAADYVPKSDVFRKLANIPYLDRIKEEPIVRSAAMLLHDSGDIKIYYTGNLSGFEVKFNNVMAPRYTIKYNTESTLHESNQLLYLKDNEFGLARPWVIKDGIEDYKMWYSIRSLDHPYKMGYAVSKDGIYWTRKDEEVGITWSEQGWDSEMICFPCVVDVDEHRYMFYNGNKHGESGFGYAELEED